jgi:flagellar biosynthetic protein FliO
MLMAFAATVVLCVLVASCGWAAAEKGSVGINAKSSSQKSEGSNHSREPNRTDDYIASLEAAAKSQQDSSDSSIRVSVLRILASLVLVVALAYATTHVLRRYVDLRGPLTHRQRAMRILESLSLGPGRTLHLVEIGSRKFVVGSTATSIATLAELAEGDLSVGSTITSSEPGRNPSSFRDYLALFLGIKAPMAESSRRIARLLRDTTTFLQEKQSNLSAMRRRLEDG